MNYETYILYVRGVGYWIDLINSTFQTN